MEEEPTVTTPPAMEPTVEPTTTPTFTSSLFGDTGLRENYTEVLEQHGLSHASGVLKNFKNPDEALKGSINALNLVGKRINQLTPQEFSSLPDEQQQAIFGKLNNIPSSPQDYNLAFLGEDVDQDVKDYWSQFAHEANLNQSQVESLAPAIEKYMMQQIGAQEEGWNAEQAQMLELRDQELGKLWGDETQKNYGVIEDRFNARYDSENPVHQSAIQDPKLAEDVYKAALYDEMMRGEGKMPQQQPVSNNFSNMEQLSKLQKQYPNWRELPEIKQQMEELSNRINRR